MKDETNFPPGWDAAQVRQVLEHYERQTDAEAAAEDAAAFADPGYATMLIPQELVPAVRDLLARYAG